MITIQRGNPGLTYKRYEALTNKQEVLGRPGAIYSMILRNATTAVVYVNFYPNPAANVTVGGGSASEVRTRIMVPAAASSSFPEQLIITPGAFPVQWFRGGITICPVLTDSDAATAGGTVYVELQIAPDEVVS
jgi:hypothetical protein